MLSAQDLDQMRMTTKAALPDKAAIQRRTLTPDGYGNVTETWSTIQWIECRVARDTGKKNEAEQGGVVTATALFTITLPWDAVVSSVDRLNINGDQYEIVEPITDTSWRLSRRFWAKKVL